MLEVRRYAMPGTVRGAWTKLWIAALALVLWSQARAAIDFEGVLGAIPESICNAALFLQGPVGFAVVAVIFIIGLIRILAGNRGGLGFVITAFVIGLVLIAAPEILAIFTEDGCI